MIKGYTQQERLSLKNHPEFTERWVQELIANDPSIITSRPLGSLDRSVHPRRFRNMQDARRTPDQGRAGVARCLVPTA